MLVSGKQQDVQFSDMPKQRRPKTKPQESYVPQASSASATTTKLLQKRRKNQEWQQVFDPIPFLDAVQIQQPAVTPAAIDPTQLAMAPYGWFTH